jgi:hypothetical protein
MLISISIHNQRRKKVKSERIQEEEEEEEKKYSITLSILIYNSAIRVIHHHPRTKIKPETSYF